MKKNEAYPSTFYNFYEPSVNRGIKKRSILEQVFLHPDNCRKTLMQTLCGGEIFKRAQNTPTQDLEAFTLTLRRDTSVNKTFCTSWQQFRVLVYQREQLRQETHHSSMKLQQPARAGMRSHDRNQAEQMFANFVAAVAPFCYTIQEIQVLRFLMLSARVDLLTQQQKSFIISNLLVSKLDSVPPASFDVVATLGFKKSKTPAKQPE
jgi:hypothetical protein